MWFLARWLAIDILVHRIVRWRTRRRYGIEPAPTLSGPYPRPLRPPATFVVRRPLAACGVGCLALFAFAVLLGVLFVDVVRAFT